MGPMVYLVIALGLALPATYGALKVKHSWEMKAAYDKGIEVGKSFASAATVASATKTAEAERAATDETPLPTDRADIIALCKRSASCKERRTVK